MPNSLRDRLIQKLQEAFSAADNDLGNIDECWAAAADAAIAEFSKAQVIVYLRPEDGVPILLTSTDMISAIKTENTSLRAILKQCEWSSRLQDDSPACPLCGTGISCLGHSHDCPLAIALSQPTDNP